MQLIIIDNKWETMGSGCGSVGRAVVSDARGPQFKSSHQPNLYWTFIYLFTINCIEKTKINKEAGNGPLFFKKKWETKMAISPRDFSFCRQSFLWWLRSPVWSCPSFRLCKRGCGYPECPDGKVRHQWSMFETFLLKSKKNYHVKQYYLQARIY